MSARWGFQERGAQISNTKINFHKQKDSRYTFP